MSTYSLLLSVLTWAVLHWEPHTLLGWPPWWYIVGDLMGEFCSLPEQKDQEGQLYFQSLYSGGRQYLPHH